MAVCFALKVSTELQLPLYDRYIAGDAVQATNFRALYYEHKGPCETGAFAPQTQAYLDREDMSRMQQEIESYRPDAPLAAEELPLFQDMRSKEEYAEESESEVEIDDDDI